VFAALSGHWWLALPEELLFRGYLMGTLDRRVAPWARVALPPAFAAVRAVRFLPEQDLG